MNTSNKTDFDELVIEYENGQSYIVNKTKGKNKIPVRIFSEKEIEIIEEAKAELSEELQKEQAVA